MLNLFQHPWFGTLLTMQFERVPCVYILASGHHGALYIGVTSDLIARIWQHREGAIASFTKRYKIHRLVHYEVFDEMESAILREKQLKNWRRQWKINLLERDNPHWADLAVGLGLPPLDPSLGKNGS